MRKLPIIIAFMLFLSAFFCSTLSANDDYAVGQEQLWIQSILEKHDESISSNNYIFYCTGHHGVIWSLITFDSAEIRFYNGTTRHYIDTSYTVPLDTLLFIKDNVKTITWGYDSLAIAAKSMRPLERTEYSPFYNELYVIKDGKMLFRLNNAISYAGQDSIGFNRKLNRLKLLMLGLAAPSLRPYLPSSYDTLTP